MIPPRPAPPRQGPRPLALHLATAQAAWLSSLAALPNLKNGSLDLKLSEPLRNLAAEFDSPPSEAQQAAVRREVARRLGQLAESILAYRHHPYRRNLPDPPVLWEEGTTRLLDYGGLPEATAPGRPVLFVPSLINRAYILDLSAKRSYLRWLAAHGFRPLLVDWGWPGEVERRFSLTDYIAGRLARALDVALTVTGGRPMPAVGYCMGGLLAIGLAQLRQADLAGVALLATPWNFQAEYREAIEKLVRFVKAYFPLLEHWGELPVDILQALFSALDPLTAAKKFSAFSRMDPASDKAAAFVALEDWLNDGIPVVASVAVECLAGWYGQNSPAAGTWEVAGQPVRPQALTLPSLHVIPSQDRIVPPASSMALARLMPGAERLDPPLGHIGMMVGGNAIEQVWQPLANWLAAKRDAALAA